MGGGEPVRERVDAERGLISRRTFNDPAIYQRWAHYRWAHLMTRANWDELGPADTMEAS